MECLSDFLTLAFLTGNTVPSLLDQAKPILESCRETTAALADIVPPDQFWKWKDMWSISLRNAVFAATMVGFLQTGKLLTIAEVASVLDSMELSLAQFLLCAH